MRSFKLDFVPFKNLRYLGIGGLSEYELISKSSQSCYKNSLNMTLDSAHSQTAECIDLVDKLLDFLAYQVHFRKLFDPVLVAPEFAR